MAGLPGGIKWYRIVLWWEIVECIVITIATNNMFIGEYTHTLDAKRRLSLPAKFRKELGKKAVITHGLDACLFIYPIAHWESVAQKLGQLSMGQSTTRGFNRFILSGASDQEIDSLGRMLIPDYLAVFANLKGKAVVIGVNDRIEIWNEHAWSEYKARIAKEADSLAEKLGEIGVL